MTFYYSTVFFCVCSFSMGNGNPYPENSLPSTEKTNGTVVNADDDESAGSESLSGMVIGGAFNDALGEMSLVGAGIDNAALASNSIIGGGTSNTASGDSSFVGSGEANLAAGPHSFIGSGVDGEATAEASFVGGGGLNSASGAFSFVGGGYNNYASGFASAVIGGIGNSAKHDNSFVFGGNVNKDCLSSASNQFKVCSSTSIFQQHVDINGKLSLGPFVDVAASLEASVGRAEFALRCALLSLMLNVALWVLVMLLIGQQIRVARQRIESTSQQVAGGYENIETLPDEEEAAEKIADVDQSDDTDENICISDSTEELENRDHQPTPSVAPTSNTTRHPLFGSSFPAHSDSGGCVL